jgi:hypothetical protein
LDGKNRSHAALEKEKRHAVVQAHFTDARTQIGGIPAAVARKEPNRRERGKDADQPETHE